MGDFYDLALKRKVENDRLRVELAEKDWENQGLRIQLDEKARDLLEADREIKALQDELDYARQECDDAERQLGDVLDRPCPVCKVKPGDPCVTPLAYRMPKPHTTR